MSDLETAYQQGIMTAPYGPDCTCPFAYGPLVISWWLGYYAGLGMPGKYPWLHIAKFNDVHEPYPDCGETD